MPIKKYLIRGGIVWCLLFAIWPAATMAMTAVAIFTLLTILPLLDYA